MEAFKRIRIGCIGLFLLSMPALVWASTQELEQLLQDGEWVQAVDLYEAQDAEYLSADPAFWNALAVAYAHVGDLPKARWSIERGWAMAPSDVDIAVNQQSIRSLLGLEDAQTENSSLLAVWNVDVWVWLAVASLFFLCLFLFPGILKMPRRLRWVGAIVLFVLVGVAGSMVYMWALYLESAIVIAADPVGRVAPVVGAQVVMELKPGERVHLGEVYGDFVRIERLDGSQAWMPQGLLRRID